MEKLGVLLANLAVCISAWCGPALSSADEKPRAPDWQPIIGFSHPTQKVFYDKNNMVREGDISGGSFLFFDSKPMTIVIRNRSLTFNSIVKHIVIDCKDNILIPLYDLFYSVNKPSDKDTPIQGIDYQSGETQALPIQRSSLIYQTLCPIQV